MSDGKKFWRVWAAYGMRQVKINGGAANWRRPCFHIAAKGAECVDICFDENRYKYILANGEYLPVEVPRDKYGDAVRRMEYYFDRGCLPNLKREEASRLVVRSLYTYEQMKNITCSGKVPVLRFNEQTGYIEVRHYCGITFVLLFAMAVWQGKRYEQATDIVFDNLLSIDFIKKKDVKKRFDAVFTAEQLFQNSLHSAMAVQAKPGFMLFNQRTAAAAGSVVGVISRTFGNIISRRNNLVKEMSGGKMKDKIPENAKAILAIIRGRFTDLLNSHLAGSLEIDSILDRLRSSINYSILNEMKNSSFKHEFADRLIHKHVHNIIDQRAIVEIVDETAVYKMLTKKLRA